MAEMTARARARHAPDDGWDGDDGSVLSTRLWVCSQCSTCGLPQQEDSLPELIVRMHTVSYRIMVHSQDIKRLQLNRLPQQVR